MVAFGSLKEKATQDATGLTKKTVKALMDFFGKTGNSKDDVTKKKWNEGELYRWVNQNKDSKAFRAHIRGQDVYTEEILMAHYKVYLETYNRIEKLNEAMLLKNPNANVIRRDPFPSPVSENIAKFAIGRRYGENKRPTWQCQGDLMDPTGKRQEVKGFSSDGPISFGPTEKWDSIYFVDCRTQNQFIVYECLLSNSDSDWRKIKLSECHTYDDQCSTGRRPRHGFDGIKKQLRALGHPLKLIFRGSFDDLFTAKKKSVKK